MKHAYLILAHNEWVILQTLLDCIDDERNDIFVHIDAKVKELPQLHTEKSSLHILTDRVDVRWGDLSVVDAECKLFAAASANDTYEYYHLLSGVDLPLRSQDYIHRFFSVNRGREFIGFSTYDAAGEVRRKVNYWHLFPMDFKNRSSLKRALRAVFIRIQTALHITRNRKETFRKGTQWVSVTDAFARYLVGAYPWIRKTFTHTFCPDEIYKQTLCWGLPHFRQRVYDLTDEGHGCVRAVGWREDADGNWQLKDWSAADYEELAASDALFARKFNGTDMDFIGRIVELSKR